MDYITNDNDLFFIFDMMRQVKPHSAVDVGVALKRMGVLSRQIKNLSFSNEIRLVGAEPNNYPYIGIYDTVYDELTRLENLTSFKQFFDLAFLIEISSIEEYIDLDDTYRWLSAHARYIAADEFATDRITQMYGGSRLSVKPISVENDRYSFISIGANR